MTKPSKRPPIQSISSSKELKRWYWLKTELVSHARAIKLTTSGAKFDLLDRISHYLDTGEGAKTKPGVAKTKTKTKPKAIAKDTAKAKPKLDWHSAALTPRTRITDSYRNTQNVRRFFTAQIGPSFKFNIAFMAWMKANVGATLSAAVKEYQRLDKLASQPGHKTKIKPHNQFNQYCRDFMAANPKLSMKDARRVWSRKRQQPSATGRHFYEPSDLGL